METAPPIFVQTWLQQQCKCPFLSSACCSLNNPFISELCGVDLQWFQEKCNKLCQIPKNSQCKWLLASWSAPRTYASSLAFPEKLPFYMGKIVSTEEPNLVPPQRIDDYVETHILRCRLCDLQFFNHQNCPLWTRRYQCVFSKKTSEFSSSNRYCNSGLLGKNKMLCLLGTTFARGSKSNSWEELEISRCSGTHSSTNPCSNSYSQSGTPRHFYFGFRYLLICTTGLPVLMIPRSHFHFFLLLEFRCLSQFPAMKM